MAAASLGEFGRVWAVAAAAAPFGENDVAAPSGENDAVASSGENDAGSSSRENVAAARMGLGAAFHVGFAA